MSHGVCPAVIISPETFDAHGGRFIYSTNSITQTHQRQSFNGKTTLTRNLSAN